MGYRSVNMLARSCAHAEPRRKSSAGRCRTAPSEREVDRGLSSERRSGRELRGEQLGPEPLAQAVLQRVVDLVIRGAEANVLFVDRAEESRGRDVCARFGQIGND